MYNKYSTSNRINSYRDTSEDKLARKTSTITTSQTGEEKNA